MKKRLLLKEVQLVQMEMLNELDRLCRKHGIRYFLCGGTLIGAVRHEGFIPWDDDIDVMLLRQDYEKLMQIMQKELDPRFFSQTFDTDKGYINMFSKIRRNDTLFVERSVETQDIHQGISLDVFPMDNIPDSKALRRIHKGILSYLDVLRLSSNLYTCRNATTWVKRMARYAIFPVAKVVVHRPFLRLVDIVAKLFQHRQTKYVSTLYGYDIRFYDDPIQAQESALYEDVEYKKFEGLYFPVPAGWHEYLTLVYGNYMELPPPERRNPQRDAVRIKVGKYHWEEKEHEYSMAE